MTNKLTDIEIEKRYFELIKRKEKDRYGILKDYYTMKIVLIKDIGITENRAREFIKSNPTLRSLYINRNGKIQSIKIWKQNDR